MYAIHHRPTVLQSSGFTCALNCLQVLGHQHRNLECGAPCGVGLFRRFYFEIIIPMMKIHIFNLPAILAVVIGRDQGL